MLSKYICGGVVILSLFVMPAASSSEGSPGSPGSPAESSQDPSMSPSDRPLSDYETYLAFFEEVFKTMQENYFQEVRREDYERFLGMFKEKIYSQLQGEHKSSDYIKWRSAAYLVDFLKVQDDIFSAFMPPQAAEAFAQEVLGKRIDLGIEGEIVDTGYLVGRVEPRADAYERGLRAGDIIVQLNAEDVRGMDEARLKELLLPMEGESVTIVYVDHADGALKTIAPVSKEYFKQFVSMASTNVPGVYCIRIERFNQMTAEDMGAFMAYIIQQGAKGLIIDLRGNPGGPPLAARAISSFFLTPDEEFAYFQRLDEPKMSLSVPNIPPAFHFNGEIVILIDEKSGSSSELFSGILQRRGRAQLMGVNSAGQVFLKRMFDMSDQSMLLLVTARGHHPDGAVFSFSGLEPDLPYQEGEDKAIHYAALYLGQKIYRK